jgi:DNA-binding NarL/FixJ family response regulator
LWGDVVNEAGEAIKVLIADDHVLIRHGIKKIIQNDPRFLIVGEVSDGQELMKFAEVMEAHVVILDISMPGISGMEAISLLKEKCPWIKILMLTMHKNKQYFYSAMGAGADGYLLKDDSDRELLIALEKIVSGKNYISPYMAEDCADDVITLSRGEKKMPFQELTKREKEILQLVVKGYTSKKMAVYLNLSQRTIDHHRSNLLRKFNRKNTVDLVNYAVRNGFVSPE